jgi:hypothetical protein
MHCIAPFGGRPRCRSSAATNAHIPSGNTFKLAVADAADAGAEHGCTWNLPGQGATQNYSLGLSSPPSCWGDLTPTEVLQRVSRIFIYNPDEDPAPIDVTGMTFTSRYEL